MAGVGPLWQRTGKVQITLNLFELNFIMKKKKIIPYEHHLVEKAKELRKNSTYSERILWKYLKGKQLEGLDFDRQKPIDKYIVDFFCNEMMLVIEIDGITHNERVEYDLNRQKQLEKIGLHVLRFNAMEVVNNTQGVVHMIRNWVTANKEPTP